MSATENEHRISVDQLRVGVYVYLDVGWMEHPFNFNNFKIKTEEQLQTIRSLGLASVRWAPSLSDVKPLAKSDQPPAAPTAEELARQAEPLVPQVIQRQQQRFLERWHEALGAAQAAASMPGPALQERALHEAATFAIRIDVAEELSRLASHLDEIERLLKTGGELGKRLDFLIQELQREANTLGSKSAALELTTISVEMKVLVEQMREQVQNIE